MKCSYCGEDEGTVPHTVRHICETACQSPCTKRGMFKITCPSLMNG